MTEPTQYWSLTPDAAWAELIRHKELRSESELDFVRMPIWVARVPSGGLANLFDVSVLEKVGLAPADLTDDNWTRCHRALGELRHRYRGVLAPSAALPGGTSVTLFGPRRRIGFDQRPVLASAVPADIVAIGRPPEDLVDRVVHRRGGQTLF